MTARLVAGEPTPSDESKEVRWVSPSDVVGYRDGPVDAIPNR